MEAMIEFAKEHGYKYRVEEQGVVVVYDDDGAIAPVDLKELKEWAGY